MLAAIFLSCISYALFRLRCELRVMGRNSSQVGAINAPNQAGSIECDQHSSWPDPIGERAAEVLFAEVGPPRVHPGRVLQDGDTIGLPFRPITRYVSKSCMLSHHGYPL